MTQPAIVPSGEFAPISFAPKPCWTCVRRRVKCDLGLPTCFKCRKNDRECLGYGSKPIVWTGVACRKKTKGQKTNGSCVKSSLTDSPRSIASDGGSHIPHCTAVVSTNPTDPLFQDLNLGTRRNIEYCKSLSITYVHKMTAVIRNLIYAFRPAGVLQRVHDLRR
jgi:hypothetical protein